jgi:poly(3-hydroxybutyrate) depolymerase
MRDLLVTSQTMRYRWVVACSCALGIFSTIFANQAPIADASLVNGDVLTIRQTWSQEPNGFVRTTDVLVPSGEGPFPVVIMLHGMGGDSNFVKSICAQTPHFDNVIRVAPNGYLKSWNDDTEPSKAPDVAFIRDLINRLKTYDNVDAGKISLLGFSNGSALINRLLIELDGAAFQKAACVVAQMIAQMYHDGSFWYNATGNNNYDQKITPAPGRKIISISGTADPIVPYLGGDSVVGTQFLDCQESIYRFAQAMGEDGPQIADADGIPGNLNDSDSTNDYSPQFVKYSYLKGEVIHYKLIGGGHGLDVDGSVAFNMEALKIIADFLLK